MPGYVTVPTAGDVTIDLDGELLAKLRAPDYAEVYDVTWGAGDPLEISAAGGDIHAFSGTLETPATVSNLSPAIGGAPTPVPPNKASRLS